MALKQGISVSGNVTKLLNSRNGPEDVNFENIHDQFGRGYLFVTDLRMQEVQSLQ